MTILSKNKTKAFTLIELLVVVAIIGILATVVVVNLSSSQNKARDAKVKADMVTVQKAASLYYVEKGAYPGLNCSPSGTLCSTLTDSDTNITTIINAAKDLTTANSALAFAFGGATYQALAALPSNTSQSLIISDAGTVAPSNVPVLGLVGWWKLDDSSDSSGNSNTGSLAGSASLSVGRAGHGNNLFINVGNPTTNSYLSIPSTSLLQSNNFTLSIWYNRQVVDSYNGLFQKGGNSATLPYLALHFNAGSYRLEVSDVGFATRQLNTFSSNYNANITGTWFHVVLTYDGANFRMYHNGGTPDVRAWSNGLGNNTYGIQLGSFWGGGLHGAEDDVRFYNRVLSDTEVTALYNAER